jgi:carbon monoxide dehydrogenase subunit G
MHIDSTFEVVAPINKVWDTLMDFERVAGCVPGAKILNKLSEDAYQVGMTVKLGPVNMQYKGLLNVVERHAADHRAVLSGKAQETRGQGTAEATVTLVLTEDGRTTRGTVTAGLALSGKAAAMGKAVIGSVTEQMMSLFAKNLQAMLAETAPEPAVVSETAPETHAAPAPARAPAEDSMVGSVAGSAPSQTSELPSPVPMGVPPAIRGAAASPSGGLDALSLAKGVAADQLSSPGRIFGLMAVVACFAYWAGRRSAFRMLRLCGRL